jgi:hypothetical protein
LFIGLIHVPAQQAMQVVWRGRWLAGSQVEIVSGLPDNKRKKSAATDAQLG